jgi:hypothetical protein
MPQVNNNIMFKFGLQASYDAIPSKDVNTLYFTTDKQRLFVGDIEYTRPINRGASLPDSMLPPDSLFVLVSGGVRDLYYSKDGTSWEQVAHLPAVVTGGVFGNNTTTSLGFAGKFKVPKVTVDNRGAVTAIEDVELTLPAAPDATTITVVGNDGAGNVITGMTSEGTTVTVTKGTMATPEDVSNAVSNKLDKNAEIAAATKTKITYDKNGLVTKGEDLAASDIPNLPASKISSGTLDVARIPNITLAKVTDAGTAAAKNAATSAISDNATSNDLVSAAQVATYVDGRVADLAGAMHFIGVKTTIPTSGTFHDGDVILVGNKEYVFSTASGSSVATRWVELGDESIYAVKGAIVNADIAANAAIDQSKINGLTEALNAKANAADIPDHLPNPNALKFGSKTYDGSSAAEITKADIGLGNVDNTADSVKNVASAAKLTNGRTIGISGAVTGTATEFDGSKNITINTTSVDGSKVNGKVSAAASADSATTATKATQDAEGNVISTTYATKTELANAALVWGTF